MKKMCNHKFIFQKFPMMILHGVIQIINIALNSEKLKKDKRRK